MSYRVNRTSGLTGFHLKITALVTMLIDHVAAVVLWHMLNAAGNTDPAQWNSAGQILFPWVQAHWDGLCLTYDVMRLIGRLSFPIYGFLLVEGFHHTRSIKKYAARLAAFALLSEIPFDLAFNGTWMDGRSNNVFITLLLGLLLLWGMEWAQRHSGWPEWMQIGVMVLMGIGLAAAAELTGCDYGGAGVWMIFLMELLRRRPAWGYSAGILVLTTLTGAVNELAAFASLPLVYRYNGQRGKPMKYGFYLFYPVHLLVLTGVMRILVG